MAFNGRQISRASAWTAALLAAGTLTACTAPQSSTPQTVAVNNPSVTYKYETDEGLIEAGRKADAYCAQYRSMPRAADVSAADSQGFRTVNFECVTNDMAMAPQAPLVPMQPVVPGTSYTYRTDLDLLQASKNAQSYCTQRGMRESTSHIVANGDGTKTVTFQCVPA